MYEKTYRFCLGLWLVLMLNFSSVLTLTKAVLLLLIFFFSLYEFFCNKFNVKVSNIIVLLLWIILCLISYLHGMNNGFDFSYSLLNYIFLTPLTCLFISSNINLDRFVFVNKVLLVSLWVAVLVTFIYLCHIFNLIHIPSSILNSGIFGGVTVSDDFLEIRLSNQSSLMFLIPYYITLLAFKNNYNKPLSFLTLFCCILIVVMSGRRALQIVTIFSGILSYLMIYYINKNIGKSLLILFLSLIIVPITLYFLFELVSIFSNLDNPFNTFISSLKLAFDSSQHSTVVRSEQAVALFDFWNKSILWGSGLNSHPLYLRNLTDKWSYEWFYLAFLAQNGLVITLFFVGTMIAILFKYIAASRHFLSISNINTSAYLRAFFVGSLGFIIASGTNPMLQFYWFWFLFLIVTNNCLKKARNEVL